MPLIVISDIFGKTTALDDLCADLGYPVQIIDPYDGTYMDFENQAQAYDAFMDNMGVTPYARLLASFLEKALSPATLIGFSVGAAAAWLVSGTDISDKADRAVCFYGSRIRHHLDISPVIPVDAIFPAHEPGFDVQQLTGQLSGKKKVTVHQTGYLHGFMNRVSENFDRPGYDHYMDWLRRAIASKALTAGTSKHGC